MAAGMRTFKCEKTGKGRYADKGLVDLHLHRQGKKLWSSCVGVRVLLRRCCYVATAAAGPD
jgi:hypothetical protein